jgi:hypothetical protein
MNIKANELRKIKTQKKKKANAKNRAYISNRRTSFQCTEVSFSFVLEACHYIYTYNLQLCGFVKRAAFY